MDTFTVPLQLHKICKNSVRYDATTEENKALLRSIYVMSNAFPDPDIIPGTIFVTVSSVKPS